MSLALRTSGDPLSEMEWQYRLYSELRARPWSSNLQLPTTVRLDDATGDMLRIERGSDSTVYLQANAGTRGCSLVKVYRRDITSDTLDDYRYYTERAKNALDQDPGIGEITVNGEVCDLELGIVPVGAARGLLDVMCIVYERRDGWIGGCNVLGLASPKYPLRFLEVSGETASSFLEAGPLEPLDTLISDLALRKMQQLLGRAAPPAMSAQNMIFVLEPMRSRVRLMVTDLLIDIERDVPRLAAKKA